MSIKYSVLMSVYKKENPDFLKDSIQSMLNQTKKPNEFVLIEDGPLTKELYDVIDSFCIENPKLFNIIKLEKNVGLGPALAIGVEKARYNYIARMDSDEIGRAHV